MGTTKVCTGCGADKPIEAFAWKDRRRGRRQPRCRPCHAEWRRARYAEIPEAQLRSVRRSRGRRRARNRVLVDTLKDRPCADCGGRFSPEGMDFDHVRGVKVANIADVVSSWSAARLLEEAAKCDVVCASCHRIRTGRRRRGA